MDILEAAAQEYPNNLSVRKAVAGGYAKEGRGPEALEIFKSVSLDDAGAACAVVVESRLGEVEGDCATAHRPHPKTMAASMIASELPNSAFIVFSRQRRSASRGEICCRPSSGTHKLLP